MTKALGPYLWARKNSRFIWFRMAVPKAVQHRYGTKPIMESLNTTDPREAAVLAGKKRAELFAQWGLLPSADAVQPAALATLREPTINELEEAAVIMGYDLPKAEADTARSTLRGKGPIMFQGHVRWTQMELEDHIRAVATGDFSTVEEEADAVLEALGAEVSRGSSLHNQTCALISEARSDHLRAQYRISSTGIEAEPSTPLVRRVKDRERLRAKPGETILELFEDYAKQRVVEGRKRLSGIDQDRMVVTLFADFVGRDRAIKSITRDECREFRNTVAKLPPNFAKRNDYKGLGLKDIAAQARQRCEPTLSAITRARYTSTVAPLFDWLVEEGYAETQPFHGLHQRVQKRRNPRPPFSTSQIETMLRSPLFKGFLQDGKEHIAGHQMADDWRKWIPLMCLFTGARIGEIAQLQLRDIVREHGIWCFHLRDDEKAGQRTKSGKSRIVPIHSTLIAIGVLDFVERQRKSAKNNGNRQLFVELQPGKRGQYGDDPSDWWRDYLTRIGMKQSGDGYGAHSFRHTMTDQLRAAGFQDREFGPLILGHADTITTTGYGTMLQGTIERRRDMIEAAAFVPISDGRVVEGGQPIDFSHLR